MRVDIDNLLLKAEEFYAQNVEKLRFIALDDYKIQIYLLYQKEWLATGAGYDDKVGALWVNPSTCKPVGSTIAHEIGHCFQYMIYCDKLKNNLTSNMLTGFRYGHEGSKGGNTFWEQCAQWQSFQTYPYEAFADYNMDVWFKNNHRAFENEWMRYQSYWYLYYISEKHGVTAISDIWKNSNKPEDSISAYKRLFLNDDTNLLNDELYDYASKMASFDIESIKTYGEKWLDKYKTTLYSAGDGYMQVAYESCPSQTGFNVINIENPKANEKIKIDFSALPQGASLSSEDPGNYMVEEKIAGNVKAYNITKDLKASYRYGFVTLLNTGERIYSPMNKEATKTIELNVPENAKSIYFVVSTGTETYYPHPWNEDERDDIQLPYKIRIVRN